MLWRSVRACSPGYGARIATVIIVLVVLVVFVAVVVIVTAILPLWAIVFLDVIIFIIQHDLSQHVSVK
jgi:hypothetical protein